jgi:hypothetical protein
VGAVLADRPGWRPDQAGVRVLEGLAGGWPSGDDAAVVRVRAAALVPVLLGGERLVGPGDQDRARDFCRYLQIASSPGLRQGAAGPAPGKYAPSTAAHCETVCRSFYGYHLEAGTGPIVNPFPLARPGRAHAHHNPLDPFTRQKSGLFRPQVPRRVPRQIPDSAFNELFARLGSNRDRALVAFWVSTGARASELLSAARSGADPGQQLITVIRKGSRAIQQLPASPDAFVWLRLYQQEMRGLAPGGPDDPLWRTLRRPFRPLNYHAARMMFDRANATIGSGWTLHSLRHTAAYRLARDPGMPITSVILSFHVSRGCDLRRPVVGSVVDRTPAGQSPCFR